MAPYIVFFGGLVSLAGSFSYVRDTIRGHNKPNRMTFFMWSVAPLIATVAALSAGVTWAVVPVLVSAISPFLVFVSSFVNRNAFWQLHPSDYVCGALSALALLLWYITKEPNIAIIFAILSDAFAGFPTLIKAWRFPETESSPAYLAAAFSCVTGLLVVQTWNFASIAFPLYLIAITLAISLGIWWPTLTKRG